MPTNGTTILINGSDYRNEQDVGLPTRREQVQELNELEILAVSGGSLGGAAAAAAGGTIGTAAVVAAYKVGEFIGKELDKHTDLSDKISDWAAKNFPWPF